MSTNARSVVCALSVVVCSLFLGCSDAVTEQGINAAESTRADAGTNNEAIQPTKEQVAIVAPVVTAPAPVGEPTQDIKPIRPIVDVTVQEQPRPREGTEWAMMHWYHAAESALPRILVVGDSITWGYQPNLNWRLANDAYTSVYATSKCVTDISYPKELGYVLSEFEYKVIHLNNGLHSLGTDPVKWEAGLRSTIALIQSKQKSAKIVLVTSTPLKDVALTEKVKVLNTIVFKVAAEYGFPVDDLFTLMDKQDRSMWVDTYHFNVDGSSMIAEQVTTSIRGSL